MSSRMGGEKQPGSELFHMLVHTPLQFDLGANLIEPCVRFDLWILAVLQTSQDEP
jgi:hypothetical protein